MGRGRQKGTAQFSQCAVVMRVARLRAYHRGDNKNQAGYH